MQSWLRITPAPIKLWQLLLSAGAKPDWPDESGTTPFHLACAHGNWPVVQFLWQAGKHIINVDHADDDGQTGLHYACRFGHAAVVSVLLASRADPLAHSKHGDPAQVARRHGHESVAEMLDKWSYSVCPLLLLPVELLHHILAHLEPIDLCAVAQVCSTLNEVSSADCLWRPFCGDEAPQATSTPQQDRTSLSSCKRRYMAWLQPLLKQYPTFVGGKLPGDGLDYDCLLKFISLGDSGVGKTQMHNRFINGAYTSAYPCTIGVDFGLRTIELLGLRLKLQVWDNASQERFRIGGSFFRIANGIMLVYDIADWVTWEHARHWAQEARQHTSDTPIMLVGAKCDLEASREVTAEEGLAMARELGACGWFEVSSLANTNVDEAFVQLTKAALHKLHPFHSPLGGKGWYVPREELLKQLFAVSSLGKQMASTTARNSSPTSSSCVLQ